MKFIMALIVYLCLCGCTIERVYTIKTAGGLLTVHITDQDEVQRKFYEHGGDVRADRRVMGFFDRENLTIYSSDNSETLVHEFRHFFEGHFHDEDGNETAR